MPLNNRSNYGDVTREESLVFINSGQLAGVQTANLNYENNAQEVKYLGMGKCVNAPGGPRVGTFDLSYFILSDEIVLPHTGNSGVNGYILRSRTSTTDNFSFTSGYLTSYNCRVAVGEIPQANATFAIFGNVGKLASSESDQVALDWTRIGELVSTLEFKPTAANTISLSLDDYTTNRIVGFQISLGVSRNPIYRIGNPSPIAVKYVPPILVDVQLTMERNNYSANKLSNYPFLNKVADMQIVLRDFYLNRPVVTFSFSNMMLKTEGYSSNVDNRGTFQLGYRNYYI